MAGAATGFFEAEMDARDAGAPESRDSICAGAIVERQFENYYQPLLTSSTREISGFEALRALAASDQRHGLACRFHPGRRGDRADRAGSGSLVLEQACIDALRWPDDGQGRRQPLAAAVP